MGKPVIFSGANAKLIPNGDLVDAYDNSLTNGDKITVTQSSHGFTSSDVGRPMYLNGSTWTLAKADTAVTSEVAGFIYAVIDANTLRISTSGQCPTVGANFLEGGGSLVAGTVYFLSASTAGKVTATEPTTLGYVSKPIAVATSTTAVQFFNFRGSVVGSVNARTQITLNNNTTANVQDMGSYDAGEITGWVYIDATTDYRFYTSIRFAKTGAGSNYNLSYTTVGDTPPTGFSFTITSGGVIQYTMPSVSGYVTATFNYALNAPAVGATFPLSVSGTNVVGGTPTVDTINEYTSTNGVQIKGRTSSTDIGAGYYGEKSLSNTTSVNISSTTNFVNLQTLTLNKGFYIVTSIIDMDNAASCTGFTQAISLNTGNTTTDHVRGLNQITTATAANASATSCIANYYMKITADSTPVYQKAKATGATTTCAASIQAVRIA